MEIKQVLQIIPMPGPDYRFFWGWIWRSEDEEIHIESFDVLGQMLATDDRGETRIGFYGHNSDGTLVNSITFENWYADKPVFAAIIGVFKPNEYPRLQVLREIEAKLLERVRTVYIV